jgi:hypothetical protein
LIVCRVKINNFFKFLSLLGILENANASRADRPGAGILYLEKKTGGFRFSAMIPLKKKWVSQCSLSIAADPEILDLAARSGCIGLLIGFESISPEVLKSIGKRVNLHRQYQEAIRKIHARGIHPRVLSSSDPMRISRRASRPPSIS